MALAAVMLPSEHAQATDDLEKNLKSNAMVGQDNGGPVPSPCVPTISAPPDLAQVDRASVLKASVSAEPDCNQARDQKNSQIDPQLLSPSLKPNSLVEGLIKMFEKPPEVYPVILDDPRKRRAEVPETSEMLDSFVLDPMVRLIERNMEISLFDTRDMLDSPTLSPFADHIEDQMDASFYMPSSLEGSMVLCKDKEEEPAENN